MAKERRTYTDEFKMQMVELFNNGKSKAEITKEYDLSTSTLDRWIATYTDTDDTDEDETEEKVISVSDITNEKKKEAEEAKAKRENRGSHSQATSYINSSNDTTSFQDDSDEEISLIDLFAVLLHYKWLIIIMTLVAMIGAVIFAVLSIKMPPETSPMPNVYTPSAKMLIQESSSSGGGLSSMLSSSGLGALAGMAGVSVGGGGSSNASLATYLVSSNQLLDAITDRFNLIEKYKLEKSVRASSRKILQQKLKADTDKDSGVFSISFTDIDPEFAQQVINFVVDWLQNKFDELGLDSNKIQKENLERNIESSYNEILSIQKEMEELGASVGRGGNIWNMPSVTMSTSKLQLELEAQKSVYTQLKTQYELLKVQMQSETPIFQILERPEIPDMKSGPSRGKLCIIITFAAGFFSVFIAFALNAWKNIKNDPEAMEKLQLK